MLCNGDAESLMKLTRGLVVSSGVEETNPVMIY